MPTNKKSKDAIVQAQKVAIEDPQATERKLIFERFTAKPIGVESSAYYPKWTEEDNKKLQEVMRSIFDLDKNGS